MQVNRRQFLQSSLLAGAGLVLSPEKTLSDRKASAFFGIHPFVLNNPEAVFVMRTYIDAKTNSPAIKKAGWILAGQFLV